MEIVILGAGRVGARVGNVASRSHTVTIIDRNTSAFDRLSSDFTGQTILGNGIDVDVLKAAGTQHADVFLALTESDNGNNMAAEVAKELGARHVVARLYEPERGEVFRGKGITIVSPTVAGADRLFTLITGEGAE